MRLPLRVAAVALGATLVLAACSDRERTLPKPSKAFCDAAHDYEEKIQSKHPPSVADQITIVERMATNAPSDVRHDADAFLAAMRRVSTDPSVKRDPEVRAAVNNVNRRASNGCGFLQSDTGEGM